MMITEPDSALESSEDLSAAPPPDRPPRPSGITVRIACHLSGAALFVVVLVADLAHGWIPTGDDAIIAQRAWGVFSAHPPLIGQFSQVSHVQAVYDPGPLLFWLLAIPVRVDPVHGVLWGSVLLCLVGVALAIEAAWAFRGAPAAAAAVVVFAVTAATQAFVVVNPAWNISIGVVWFVTTVVVAVTVGSGRLGWWPVLVGAGSMAAQAHLEFAAGAIGLIILGLALGLARRPVPRRWRWLATGCGVGVLCWAAPLVDQLTGRGNVTVLWDLIGQRATFGTRFGLQALAAAAGPHPLWVNQQNRGSVVDAFLVLLSHVNGQSMFVGVAILASLALVAAGCWLCRRRDLAVLATVALLVAATGVWEFASLPQTSVLTIVYSDTILWPLGMLVWLVWLWTAAALCLAGFGLLRRRWRRPAADAGPEDPVPTLPGGDAGDPAIPVGAVVGAAPAGATTPGRHRAIRDRSPRGRGARRWATALLAVAVVAVGAAASTVATSTVADPHLSVPGGWSAVRLVPAGAAAVDRVRPRGPVAIYAVGDGPDADYSVAYGVIWLLRHDGRDVTGSPGHWQPLGPGAAPARHEPRATLHLHPDGTVTVTVARS